MLPLILSQKRKFRSSSANLLPTESPLLPCTPGHPSPSHNTTSALYRPRVTLSFHVSSYEPLLFLRQRPRVLSLGRGNNILCSLLSCQEWEISKSLMRGNFYSRACANSWKKSYVKTAVKCFELYIMSGIERIIYLSIKIKCLLTLRMSRCEF